MERHDQPESAIPDLPGYFYDTAQHLAHDGRDHANCRYKLDDSDTSLDRYVRAGLTQRWSPEEIVCRWQRDHQHSRHRRITPETIYRWVYRRNTLGEHWHVFADIKSRSRLNRWGCCD